MKIWTYTFGCKVNQYETELLRHRLTGAESRSVADHKDADLCLINTCSVTAFADKEARQMIRRVLRENAHARTIVTGCYATRAPKEIRSISSRLEIYSNQEKDQLPSCVGYEVSDQPLGIHQFAGRTRAFLKVQDGCKAPCRYCIIPTVRPTMWSKPLEKVLQEAEALLENGYQEIVLTGIRLGLYRSKDDTGSSSGLIPLLKKLCDIPKKFRIRLSSLEVTEVTDDLLDFVKGEKKVCRHFHIPLQSGDSEVLKFMGRWYNAADYENRIRAVQSALPDCGLTADVMVGYPTETDQQFQNTHDFIDRLNLSGLHVFRYSAREGTRAAQYKLLHPQIVSKRAKILGSLDEALRERFYRRFEGQVREVIPEPTGDAWTDNYIRVQLPAGSSSEGLTSAKVYNPALFKRGNP